MSVIAPREGFDWERVEWFSYLQSYCSYCNQRLADTDALFPLIMFHVADQTAVFCDECASHWFGVEL
jgi:hypothetical protein